MNKTIDIKERIVELSDLDTGDLDPATGETYEDLIVKWLNKKMKVRFMDIILHNSKYVFQGNPKDKMPNSIVVSSYRIKQPNEKVSIDISTSY